MKSVFRVSEALFFAAMLIAAGKAVYVGACYYLGRNVYAFITIDVRF